MKIIVVDDQKDAQYLLQALLTGHGHEISIASNGQEALDLARATPPDLIISDILMPVMDGFQLCREIRKDEILCNVLFVFYTATYTEQGDAKFAMTIGADDFIRKPAEPDAFLARIESVIKSATERTVTHTAEPADETEVLRLYSERLVAKLEKRSLDLQSEIAQRQISEKSLRQAHDIISQSPAVAILWMNTEGWPVEYVSPNVHRLFGYTDEELLSGRVAYAQLIHPADLERVTQEVATHSMDLKTATFTHAPYRIVTKSSGNRWVDDRTAIRRDTQGNITHYQGILIDITDRIRAEEEKLAMEEHLQQTQKLESIGTLASGVAHEINNPLTGIINYADLIESRIEDTQLREFARGIQEEGDRIATIVRSLLSFARQDSETHSPARMIDIVDGCLRLIGSLLRKDQITLELSIPEDLPTLICRSQQIQQVVINLLTNARDALNERYPVYDENKRLFISAQEHKQDEISWLRTTIEDHGIGIPEDIAQTIFDPFFTTKPREKGTGLGLSISYGIIREHGGKLTVESTPGQFTKVHIDLPV
jgi:two-component system, cell cycle sensor histidine kinase and response regulator CckA